MAHRMLVATGTLFLFLAGAADADEQAVRRQLDGARYELDRGGDWARVESYCQQAEEGLADVEEAARAPYLVEIAWLRKVARRSERSQTIENWLEAVRRDLRGALEYVEGGNVDAAENQVNKAEEDLAEVEEAARAPLAEEIDLVRKSIGGARGGRTGAETLRLATARLDEIRTARARAELAAISAALALYEKDYGRYPTTEERLRVLIDPPAWPDGTPNETPCLAWDRLPDDPWGTPYYYESPGKKNPDGFDLYSAGPDRNPDSDDNLTN